MHFMLEIIGHIAIYFRLKFLTLYKSHHHKFQMKLEELNIQYIVYVSPIFPMSWLQ